MPNSDPWQESVQYWKESVQYWKEKCPCQHHDQDRQDKSCSQEAEDEDDPHTKELKEVSLSKLNEDTFHDLVRDIMEENNEERDVQKKYLRQKQLSESPWSFFEMEMTWFNIIN